MIDFENKENKPIWFLSELVGVLLKKKIKKLHREEKFQLFAFYCNTKRPIVVDNLLAKLSELPVLSLAHICRILEVMFNLVKHKTDARAHKQQSQDVVPPKTFLTKELHN